MTLSFRAQDVTYVPGDLNLIITAPHGGYTTPANVPDRHHGCVVNNTCVFQYGCTPQDATNCRVVTLRDQYTKEIAELFFDIVKNKTGRTPYLVTCNWARIKLDANREINEAAFGNNESQRVHYDFHQRIKQAREAVESQYSQGGLLIDVHGHAHANNWFELVSFSFSIHFSFRSHWWSTHIQIPNAHSHSR